MASSFDDVRRSLRSEKVTERAKAKQKCEELLQKCKIEIIGSNTDWTELLRASIDYEAKEVENDQQKKTKTNSIDACSFLYKILKFCCVNNLFHPKRCYEVLFHSIRILHDPISTNQYKSIHKTIVSELLDVRLCASQKSSYFVEVFELLKQLMKDRAGVSDSANLRLFKRFCKALYTDESRNDDMALSIICTCESEWYRLVAEDLAQLSAVASSFADGFSYLLEYNDLNGIEDILGALVNSIPIFIRQISTSQHRDNQRSPYLRFFDAYMNILTRAMQLTQRRSLLPCNLLLHLDLLITIFTSEDQLCPVLALSAGQSIGPQKALRDIFTEPLEDSKIKLYFDVAAHICWFGHIKRIEDTASSSLSIIRRLLNKVSELCERDETLNSLSNQERYLLEGNLLLLGQIFRLSASLQKILTQLQSAIFPVSILLSYTRTLSQVLSVCWRNNNFAQVKAACIHALRGLFVLGSDCMQTIPYHTSTSISSLSTHHDTQCLKDVWRGVIEVLLTESSPWRSVNAFRSRSLADAAIDIIEDIMRHDGLLGDSDKWLLQKRLWDFLLLHPIVNIESPRYFRLLALVVRNPDFESTRRLASILGPPVEPSSVKLILMSSSTASPRCVDDKSSQMVALIATWIKTRLTDTAAAKNSISSMKSVQEFIAAFSTLLNSVFGHCDSPIASDNIKATRKHLMVPSDANRVTDHEYSSAEISFAHLPSISSIDTSTNVIGETYPMSFQIVEGIMETVESVIAHLASRQEGEGFESPSSSQAGALLTLSVLSTLYSFVPNHNTVLSSAISNRVWCLLTSILQSMRISQDSNKWEPLSEFVVLLIAQLKPIKDILGHEALPPDNNECRQLLLSIITSVRNECLPGHITAGVKKSAANRFLSQSPDTSIDQPVLKKPKLTVVPIVDDDDFFDDDLKPSDSSPIKATKSGGEKKLCLSIAPEQMELIGNLTCLLLLLGTTWDEQNSSLNDVRELYTKFVNPFNESRQGNLFVKPELLLLLADTVSEDYFLPKTQVLVDAADWANDWGCLGTLKVLQYIKYSLQYISRHGLQAVSDFVERVGDWDTLVDFFITVALNQGKATQIHFAMYWRLREIQLQCVALLLQLHMLSEDELIDEARAVFIDGLIDPDIRVRMEASKLVSVLVTMSKNPHRLYATLVKNIDIPVVFERKHEDAWRVVTALATIATIGATNEETLPLCLFDLIRMCLTRYKKVKGGDAERKSERTIFVCYNDLLAHILNALRHRYEFQAPQLLVKDCFRYLFSRWIQIRGDEESLPLLSFPFYLFVDNKQTTGADLMKYSSTDFLGKFRSLIVPLVCQVSDGAYRKKLLDECLGDLPTHHSDTAVAQLLRDNYFAIQATETVLSISAHDNAMGRLENASACRKVLANTSQFVTRCIESNSQEEPAVSSQISDVVQALVDIIAMIPVDEFEADAKMTIAKGLKIIDNSRAAVPKSVISSATKSQGKASSSAAVPSLLSCCNPLALISSLHTRLFETRSPVLARSILQGLFALVDIIPIEYSSWTFAHSIIHIIYASLRSNSRRFTLAAPVLFNGLVCLVEKLTILPITPQVSSRYKGFSEQATRNVRTILRELWTLAVYCHYLTREDHTRMKGFDLDLFVLVSQSTAEDKVIVRESLDALLAPLVTVSRNAELHLTVTFAIPESLHQILSPGMRNAIESCFHSGSDEDILQQFFESATAFLRDGLCPFALLWLQVS